jgi:regulator of PEP synthase PpsR (kinase-PPPase family)
MASSTIHIEEIPLIEDDPEAIALLKTPQEKGYIIAVIVTQDSVATLRPQPQSRPKLVLRLSGRSYLFE